jgi:membrane protein
MVKKAFQFIKHDIWQMPLQGLPKSKYLLFRQLRVLSVAFKGFKDDRVSLQASALTYYCLLSIVPVVALIFGIAKGFDMQGKLQTQLTKSLEGQEQVIEYVMGFARNMLDNTKGGVIAGVGVVILLWSVMKVLGNIEVAFNDVWEIKVARNWVRKFTDYFSIMLIAPVLFILSSSVTVFLGSGIDTAAQNVGAVGYVAPYMHALLEFIPFVLIWLTLTFIYMVIPNTKVNFKSAFVAGIIGGTIFVFWQEIYVWAQVILTSYNKVYGSFAALPLFLIWLNTSWLIVLFGAEISFAEQNVEDYSYKINTSNIGGWLKQSLMLMVMQQLIKSFVDDGQSLSSQSISARLDIPSKNTKQILEVLLSCRLVSQVKTEEDGVFNYQPAQDVNTLTVNYVLNKIDEFGIGGDAYKDDPVFNNINKSLISFNDLINKSDANKLIKDL